MPRNKAHKQKFSSKRSLADKQQGRKVSAKGSVPIASKKSKTSPQTDSMRRQQQAAAMRNNKRQAVLAHKRIGSSGGPPRVIGLVPVNEAANSVLATQEIVRAMRAQQRDGSAVDDESVDYLRPITVASASTKQRFTFVTEGDGNEQDVLDVAKVSDILVLVLNVSSQVQETIKKLALEAEEQGDDDGDDDDGVAEQDADNDGDDGWKDDDRQSRVTGTTWFADIGLCITDQTRELMTLLNAQGSPTIVVALQGLETYDNPRKRLKVLKLHERYFASVAAEGTKVLPLSNPEDVQGVLRHCFTTKLRQLKWREQHPYLVIERSLYDDQTRELQVSGYLRGANLAANQLLHLTNHGTFQIASIAVPADPAALSRAHGGDIGVVDSSQPEERESLQKIQASDTVEDEGKPTEHDVQDSKITKRVRVPAGVSDYQAAWYEHEGLLEGEDPALAGGNQHGADGGDGDDDRFLDAELMSRNTTADVDLMKAADVVRVERMTDEERLEELRRLKDLSEEEQWNPDMIDTPTNLPARQRFSKYRGMKSFHGSAWHTNENLPIHFGYVFKMVNYTKIRENALTKCHNGPVSTGLYVTVTLVDVPKSVVASSNGDGSKKSGNSLLIASAQLEHEQKWSVLHFHVQRNSDLEEPLKSKTTVLVHIGFRKLYVSPLYSDASTGDRTKFARFFHQSEKFRIATFYGPISYAPCPIVAFLVPSLEEQADRVPLQLAWFGSALPPNPDLLLLKKSVLTGRVAVIHKKVVVVKYMFFNEDDVRWFMPVDIYTKFGRRGKILKAVGTKGLFKATLNDQIMQHDVICMDLYKRVFPKWNTAEYDVSEVHGHEQHDEDYADEQ